MGFRRQPYSQQDELQHKILELLHWIHKMARWLLFAVVIGATVAADVEEKNLEKIFGIPDLFSITPYECPLSDNQGTGTCYSLFDCIKKNGAAMGKCAKGFGVCCSVSATTTNVEGNTTISSNGGFFTSPGFSSSSRSVDGGTRQARNLEGETYVATLTPENKVQMLLEFYSFDIMGPTEGDCDEDKMEIIVPGSMQIPTLCGNNDGQHMYIDLSNYDSSSDEMKIVMTLSSETYTRSWNVNVTYLSSYETSHPLCLQYFTETSGVISSFNYGNYASTPQYLNNQEYTVCFKYLSNYCDIGFTFNTLSLDGSIGSCGNDYVQIQSLKLCGEETDYPVTGNATGPINVLVSSDDDYQSMNEGFELAYTMMMCDQ